MLVAEALEPGLTSQSIPSTPSTSKTVSTSNTAKPDNITEPFNAGNFSD